VSVRFAVKQRKGVYALRPVVALLLYVSRSFGP